MSTGIQRKELMEIEYPKQVKELTDSLNNQLKWNFVVRYLAKDAMVTIDKERFFQWIQTPDKPFGELKEDTPFTSNDVVSNHFFKVHELARQILLPSHENTDTYLNRLVEQFQKQSEQIRVNHPDQVQDIVQEFLNNIKRSTTHQLSITEEDQSVLFNSFAQLFNEKCNQELSDEVIEDKIKTMFAILEEDPKISSGKFAQQIRGLWTFPKEDSQNILTNLSELFVKHNPYNMTIEEVLIDAILNNNLQNLIGKSLIYRLPHHPFSIKIDKVEILPGGSIRGIKLFSPEGLSVNLRVDTQKKEITSLSFDRLVQTQLENFIEKNRFHIPFQVETKIPIPGIENPFKTGIEYKIEIKRQERTMGVRSNYTDYKFTQVNSPENSINLRVVDGAEQITIERKVRGVKLPIIKQDIPWSTYQSLFLVLTKELETYSQLSSGENSLDSRLVSLSKKPLATEGMVKKALKEKDICRMELLNELIEKYNRKDLQVCEAFDFINKNYFNTLLTEKLFNEIFDKNSLFFRLCSNQYVKAHYNKEEGDVMTLPLKNQFALDLLHEAQVCIFTYVQPKDQQGNQDLIRQLCEATQLTKTMQGVFAIPFIGPTGSGKSTTVSYIMGVPMAQFEDDFGEKRIKHKESATVGIPKIGFALGLSETIHASSFQLLPPPPFKKDPKQPFAAVPRHDPKFKNGLTKDNLRLADFPGFFDTRGTHYEIITNFSIDRAMEAFKGVPALVQVIPYENITADRAGLLYSTLKDLEAKFPSLLTDKELQKRFHFVVTKFNQIGIDQIRARLEQLINEYRSDGLSGEKYFSFLLHQLLTNNVHLLNPLSATARLQILDSIIENFDPNIDPIKKDYQGGFKEAKMQLRIGDVLHGAIICWNNLLTGFLEQQKDLSLIENQLKETNQKIENGVRDKNQKSKNLELFESKKKGSFDPEDPILKEKFLENAKASETAIEKYRNDIYTLGSEIQSLNSKVTKNLNTITTIQSEITDLGTGSFEDSLYNRVVASGYEQKFSGTWASHVDVEAKIRRQLDKGADNLSDHEGEVVGKPRTAIAGKDPWTCSRSVVLHKEYELVPNDLNESEKLKKLNELAGGVGFRSVILDDGSGWRIDIDSSGDLKFIDIKVHDSGKKFMYGYTEKCNTSPPYPKLIIKAVLPKTVYNGKLIEEKRTQVQELKNNNIQLRQQLATKQGIKDEYENQLKKLETELKDKLKVGLDKAISEAKAQLKASKDLIATLEKELNELKRQQTQAQSKQKKYAVSIRYNKEIMEGTYSCSQSFQLVDNDKLGGMVQQKNAEVFGKCQEFVKLYASHMGKVEKDVEAILGWA